MNAASNFVNLGISVFWYRGISKINSKLSYQPFLVKIQYFENLLLINAGLDLLYKTGGVLCFEKRN
jgi:hypothetical protein